MSAVTNIVEWLIQLIEVCYSIKTNTETFNDSDNSAWTPLDDWSNRIKFTWILSVRQKSGLRMLHLPNGRLTCLRKYLNHRIPDFLPMLLHSILNDWWRCQASEVSGAFGSRAKNYFPVPTSATINIHQLFD